MERNIFIIYSPAIIGMLLFIAVFTRTSENAVSRLGIESGLFLAGVFSMLVVVISIVVWLFQKQWENVFYSVASLIVFSVCFTISAYRGFIFIYAT